MRPHSENGIHEGKAGKLIPIISNFSWIILPNRAGISENWNLYSSRSPTGRNMGRLKRVGLSVATIRCNWFQLWPRLAHNDARFPRMPSALLRLPSVYLQEIHDEKFPPPHCPPASYFLDPVFKFIIPYKNHLMRRYDPVQFKLKTKTDGLFGERFSFVRRTVTERTKIEIRN